MFSGKEFHSGLGLTHLSEQILISRHNHPPFESSQPRHQLEWSKVMWTARPPVQVFTANCKPQSSLCHRRCHIAAPATVPRAAPGLPRPGPVPRLMTSPLPRLHGGSILPSDSHLGISKVTSCRHYGYEKNERDLSVFSHQALLFVQLCNRELQGAAASLAKFLMYLVYSFTFCPLLSLFHRQSERNSQIDKIST